MRGYGLPRNHDVGSPDVADMGLYGLKPSRGCRKKKCGKFKGQNPNAKWSSRRIWKKKERIKSKNIINHELGC